MKNFARYTIIIILFVCVLCPAVFAEENLNVQDDESELIPVVRLPDVMETDLSYDELKNSAIYYMTLNYENGEAISETGYKLEDGEYKQVSRGNFTDASQFYIDTIKSIHGKDAILFRDMQAAYLVTKTDVGAEVTPILPTWDKNATLYSSTHIELDDFLNATVYRNKYASPDMNVMGGGKSILDYLGKKPPTNPIVFVFIGIVVSISVGSILLTALKIRKRRKNK